MATCKCKVVWFALTFLKQSLYMADNSDSLQLHWTSLDLRPVATVMCAKWPLITSMAFWRRMQQRWRLKKLWRKYAASSLTLTGQRCVCGSLLFINLYCDISSIINILSYRQCDQLIEQYEPMLVQLLLQMLDPAFVCLVSIYFSQPRYS